MALKGFRRVARAGHHRRRGTLPSLARGHHPAMGNGRDAGRPADGMDAIGRGAPMIAKDTESALITAFCGETSMYFGQEGFFVHISTFEDYPLGAAIFRAAELLRGVVDECKQHKESTYELESR